LIHNSRPLDAAVSRKFYCVQWDLNFFFIFLSVEWQLAFLLAFREISIHIVDKMSSRNVTQSAQNFSVCYCRCWSAHLKKKERPLTPPFPSITCFISFRGVVISTLSGPVAVGRLSKFLYSNYNCIRSAKNTKMKLGTSIFPWFTYGSNPFSTTK
jgi:hypothetical protein